MEERPHSPAPGPSPKPQLTGLKDTDCGQFNGHRRDTSIDTISDGRAVNLLVWCVVEELAACQKSCDEDRMPSGDESLENGMTRLPVWDAYLKT